MKNLNITCTRQELKILKASTFKDGDIVQCGKYFIYIKYGIYDRPNFKSKVFDKNYKSFDCTPGCGIPYYIDNFLQK